MHLVPITKQAPQGKGNGLSNFEPPRISRIIHFGLRRVPGDSNSKESTCQPRRCRFDPWVGKIHPWEKEITTHSSILTWGNPMDRGA